MYRKIALELKNLNVRVTSVMPYYNRTKDEKFYYQHRHYDYEFQYIEEGSLVLYLDGKSYFLEQGTFFVIAPGVYHSQKNTSERFNKFVISFDMAKSTHPAVQQLQMALESQKMLVGDGTELYPTLQQLRQEIEQERAFSNEALKALVCLFILQLARKAQKNERAEPLEKSGLDEMRSFLIDEFFNDHFNLPAGEMVLAEQLGVSSRQLDRILKRLYGKSFREKLLEIRTEVAVDFLINTDRSVQEISELLGYNTAANFSTFFKKNVGMTPSDFREKRRLERL